MKRKLVSFDWAMKKILRQKANFEILEGFISELLKIDIKIEEILESEANQEDELDKFNRVDILAKNQNGELILIEVQHRDENDYFHRMLYGTSKLISEHINKGKGYKQVKKVYSINIIYFDLGQGFDYIYHGKIEFKGLNHTEDTLKLSQKQIEEFTKSEVSEIFPEYYIIKVNKFNDIAKNTIDEWIYFLKNEEINDNFKAKGLDVAKEQLNVMKLPKDERIKYKRSEENKMLEISVIETAKANGRIEAKIEIAKKLLDILDIETISNKTGLSIEEIQNIVKS